MAEPLIYLDYASTSPVDPAVVDAMNECLTADGVFANPASPHRPGQAARARIDEAGARIAELINGRADRLIYTSGATEANNMALFGMLAGRPGAHLITTAIEHRSILDAAAALETGGIAVTRLACDETGFVPPASIAEALRPETRLVSVMLVNNEIGTVQDIEAIAAVCRGASVAVHVDAAQGAGKVALDVDGWGIDLCSLTAHKLNGPKGSGALHVREGVELGPFLHGGEAQLGVRAGTLPTHQIVGFGTAAALAGTPDERRALAARRDSLWDGLARIDRAIRQGNPARSAPHILSVTFPGVEGESLRLALADIAVSAGSACTSRAPGPSHVLRGIGLSDVLAESTLRFGVGRFTTDAEIETAVERVGHEVERLRTIAAGAPDWCSV